MHRLERRPHAMRRIPTPPGLLATRTRTFSTAPLDAFDRRLLCDLFDDPTHIFD
jgi:hypothetical protein